MGKVTEAVGVGKENTRVLCQLVVSVTINFMPWWLAGMGTKKEDGIQYVVTAFEI